MHEGYFMGRTGKAKQVRFSEVHIYSNNFRSSYCFSRTPEQTGLDSKLFEDAAKQRQKGGSDPTGTMLTNIEGTVKGGGKTPDIVASKLIKEPFTYFLVLSISSQATVDSIIIAIEAFVTDAENTFQTLAPEMQRVLHTFGAASNDIAQEKTAITLLIEPFLQRYLQ